MIATSKNWHLAPHDGLLVKRDSAVLVNSSGRECTAASNRIMASHLFWHPRISAAGTDIEMVWHSANGWQD